MWNKTYPPDRISRREILDAAVAEVNQQLADDGLKNWVAIRQRDEIHVVPVSELSGAEINHRVNSMVQSPEGK